MAAKKGPYYPLSIDHRGKIKNSNILNALIEHAEGTREMSSTQVTAALGLLRKVLPDLSSAQIEQTVTNFVVRVPEQIETSSAWQKQYSKDKSVVRLDS